MRYRFHAPVLGYPRGAVVDEQRLDHVEPVRLASFIASGLITTEDASELVVVEDPTPPELGEPAE